MKLHAYPDELAVAAIAVLLAERSGFKRTGSSRS